LIEQNTPAFSISQLRSIIAIGHAKNRKTAIMAVAPADDALSDVTRLLSTMSLDDNQISPVNFQLPTKIISMIGESLDNKSLARCRLVCRSLADISILTCVAYNDR
jgi:hypothetical protein